MTTAPRSARTVAGNWKMFKTQAEVKSFFASLGSELPPQVRTVIAAPYTLLASCLSEAAAHKIPVQIFAQNCHDKTEGAFTGEISAAMLKDIGVKGTLVGHSERRQLFGETNETAAARALSALQAGLDVIFCVGETLPERESGKTISVLRAQCQALINGLTSSPQLAPRLEIAYEPVWAIGTGLTAVPAQISEAHLAIREFFAKFGPPKVLYGGSVKPENFQEILSTPGVDGGLVGGASLKPDSFKMLIKLST